MALGTQTVRVDLRNYSRFIARLGASFRPAVRRGVIKGAAKSLDVIKKAVQQAPPASARGSAGAFNTGAYMRGWRSRPTSDGAVIYNLVPYASVIEYGRRPGARMPPTMPIYNWLRRRAGLNTKEARKAAFAVALMIKRRGLRGRKVMTNAVPLMERVVNDCVQAEIARAVEMGGR